MRKKIIIGIILLALIVSGYLLLRGSAPEQKATFNPAPAEELTAVASLTSPQLAALLQEKDFFFVNVHTPYAGEIRNTDAFIPYNKIADNLDKLPADKNAKIILYCRSGRMSEIAVRELMKLGYTRVSHLSGGMDDWKNNGYEIVENM